MDIVDLFFCLFWCKPLVFHLWVNSQACPSNRNASSWKSTSEPLKKHTSKPVKSPYGVGHYLDMAVSPTRSHLLWFQHNFLQIGQLSHFHYKTCRYLWPIFQLNNILLLHLQLNVTNISKWDTISQMQNSWNIKIS